MKKRPGILLVSVISFLLIGTAFEMQRYATYLDRQRVYGLVIEAFRHPEMAVDSVKTNEAMRND